MAITVEFVTGSGRPSIQRKRPGRGNSVLCSLRDYTALDLETTGFSPECDEIIEISALRVRNGTIVDRFTSFVKPDNVDAVDGYITELTGISAAMLASASPISEVLPAALSFIGSDVVVGQNVSFDINFIYDNAERLGLPAFGNDYIDTMRLSRWLFPDFVNHKLRTLVKKFGIQQETTHRAESDAEATAACYEYMVQHIAQNDLEKNLATSYGHKSVRAADIVGNPDAVKADSPIFGQTVVFTGALEKMTRKEAMQLVADLGGINGDTVTKKTNFLVLGNNDYCTSIRDGKSTKQKKAEKYILAGADLQIVPETVFYDMIEG